MVSSASTSVRARAAMAAAEGGEGGGGRRLRIGVDGRARRAARSAGRRPRRCRPRSRILDPAIAPDRRGHRDHARQARHRHHHPAAAQSARAGQGARERRRRLRRAADLRPGHRLPEAGVRRARHSLRAQGRARDGVSGGDAGGMDGAAMPEYEGRFVAFRGIHAQPRPVQQPHPPIVIGGSHAGRVPPRRRRTPTAGTVSRSTSPRRIDVSPAAQRARPRRRGRARWARSRSASRRADPSIGTRSSASPSSACSA